MSRSILAALALALLLPVTASAQTSALASAPISNEPPRVTIPLEIAMIYHRLLNVVPPFEQLALTSPRLENTAEFGRNALIAEEKKKLEKVFANTKRDTPIIIREAMPLNEFNQEKQTLRISGLDADTPFIYKLGSTRYGVFIRNASNMVTPLGEPFYKGADWNSINDLYQKGRLPIIEMVLKPMGADDHDFTTYDDDTVKPIIADLVELRIYHPTNTDNLLLVKRDGRIYSNNTGSLEDMVQDDLKDENMLNSAPSLTNQTFPAKPITQ